ncbi:hypothetical protein [Corynebacterium spheniscorum]|uniref:Uncharacterized protein n=1 Tax=Corynebacterium spheniscorum TaxID=185761 RepID=A0A1I2RB13_9CORY|nr:hypothetical protein [Corynebacterium spheniscorum]KAA8722626.1 hypothetical protein F4V56_04275 [Corynebacterium spheniscorum]SFG37915.1 hypothetical protein SAMN05660282_00728 [Corynebacterium spheniscorum]
MLNELATVAAAFPLAEEERRSDWLVYLLFIAAGLLTGGTWSAYQAGHKLITIILAVLAAVALVAAVMWLMGVMT